MRSILIFRSFFGANADEVTSLLTQRCGRVDAHGASDRYVMRQERDERQDRTSSGKRCRIGVADAEHERAQDARRGSRGGKAGRQAKGDERNAGRQHQTKDVGWCRAQCHANADLTGSLGDAVPDNAVETDAGEQHGDDGEAGQQARDEDAPERPIARSASTPSQRHRPESFD